MPHNLATTCCPPHPIDWSAHPRSLFLAGSIDLGAASAWQTHAITRLSHLDLLILNPRRPDWDNSWRQHIDEDNFREQVTWELDAIERADLILMHLEPGTSSPISLLELGLCAGSNRPIAVSCPEGFWRLGNVQVLCRRYDIVLLDSLDALLDHVIEHLATPHLTP